LTKANITKDSRLARCATLAGAALTLPFAANAGLITGVGPGVVTASSSPFNWDIDGDGTADFSFLVNDSTETPSFPTIQVTALGSNSYTNVDGGADALTGGQIIDAGDTTGTGTATLQKAKLKETWKQFGPWPGDGTSAYLGIQFDIDGNMHLGWIQLSATAGTPSGGTLDLESFGYESDPEVSQITTPGAPEPSTLALLALGAAGLLVARKRKVAA
jgi:hypothetical protein